MPQINLILRVERPDGTTFSQAVLLEDLDRRFWTYTNEGKLIINATLLAAHYFGQGYLIIEARSI